MAYSLPQLVLVGAAQNLVLDPISPLAKVNCLDSVGWDEDGENYNVESAW